MQTSTEAPQERVAIGCSVSLRFDCAENSTKTEHYSITDDQDAHAARNGVLWAESCWGKRLIGLSVGETVALPAPENNVAVGTITAIDRP